MICILASSCKQHDLFILVLYSVIYSKVHTDFFPCNVTPAWFADRLHFYINTFEFELCLRWQGTSSFSLKLWLCRISASLLPIQVFNMFVCKCLCLSPVSLAAHSTLWSLYLSGYNIYWCQCFKGKAGFLAKELAS